jgi:hypothetical protein
MNETVAALSRKLRLAVALIALISLFGLALPLLLANPSFYDSFLLQLLAFGALLVVTAVATWFHWRDRSLGVLRWVLLAVVAVASVVAVTGVPADQLTSEAEWSYGIVGWIAILVLLDHGAGAVLGYLGAHTAASLAQVVVVGVDVPGMVVVTILVLGYQLPVVAVAMALRRYAAMADHAARTAADLRTAEAIALRLQEDRAARYADLASTTVPLLTELAEGRTDLTDDRVRDRYAVEAARMRRLFAERDSDVTDPLLHELRACVDLAERKGVTVYLGTCGDQPPTPPPQVRRALTEPALRTLAAAASQARVTVLGSAGGVTVSVVADARPEPLPESPAEAVTVTRLVDSDRIWVEATWQPRS